VRCCSATFLKHTKTVESLSSLTGCEIKPIMLAATGIEGRLAPRATRVARHILLDAHLVTTDAAYHGGLSPFGPRPNLDGVIRQRVVAIFAGIVKAATFHFDRDHIEDAAVMDAARLGIQSDPANLWP
jgi:hypothetical protein